MEVRVTRIFLARNWEPQNAKLAGYYADLVWQQVAAIVPITVGVSSSFYYFAKRETDTERGREGRARTHRGLHNNMLFLISI